MSSEQKEVVNYDHTEFNTRAGISDQSSHNSLSSEHSNKNALSSDKYAEPGENKVLDTVRSNGDNPISFSNDAYEFDDVPLDSPSKTEVSFDDDKQKPAQTYPSNKRESKPINVDQEKRSIIKNVLIICLAFMLLFTAFQSMSALQSSINRVMYFL